ncbi:MAG: pyruvate dehydrogenase [Candidatus Hydrogenedentes bacterium]|nr:pyruvate dehydrogenase [Candidatus Hydrogenedentota bacterium]
MSARDAAPEGATVESAAFLEQLWLIRTLEEKLLELFSQGRLFGTTHTCIGQEAIAVAVGAHVREEDFVFSSHRCHGHYLAYGGPPEGLIAEIMGRATGVCGGRGGSQHLHYKNFFTSGVQGGIVGNGTGVALAQKLLNRPGITVVFLGDGTLGEGIVYESFNFASLHALPVLYVLENNRYAQTTPIDKAVAGSITARAAAFGIDAAEIESNDVFELDNVFRAAFHHVRERRRPFLQVVHTYRLAPHSKGDDFRDPAELAHWRTRDPLRLASKNLGEVESAAARTRATTMVKDAVRAAEQAPFAKATSVPVQTAQEIQAVAETPWAASNERFGRTLNEALHRLLGHDASALLVGEDLADPYGGAFGVARGLSTQFPERVISTPISEAGIIAWATGAALAGIRPIAELMFGDFAALAADQLINHTANFASMYGGRVDMPLGVRAPMGGRRGYGATHGQSLEAMFCGVPGLTVVAPSRFLDPHALLTRCLYELKRPALFVENKLMYGQTMHVVKNGRWEAFYVTSSGRSFPTLHFQLDPERTPEALLVCYGANTDLALEAARQLLLEHEIQADVVVCTLLAPLPFEEIAAFNRGARLMATIEEGAKEQGWGAEVIARFAERFVGSEWMAERFGARRSPLPAAGPLEDGMLPQVADIVNTIARRLR